MSTAPALSYASTSRFVQAGATRIHYHEAGCGPVLLCLHGGAPGAFGWGNFGRNVAALAQHFRVIVPDLPGYGQSDKPQVQEGRNAFYAKTFCDMLEALNIDSAHVLGMATGGAIAIRLAVDSPEKIDRLVLVSAAGGSTNFAMKAPRSASQIYYGGDGPSLEKMRDYLLQLVYDPAVVTPDVVRERYEASVDPAFMAQAPEGRTEKRHTPDSLWKDVDRIRARTLIVWGRENRAQNFENAVFLHARIRDSELHVFGQCGLWVPYEKPEAFHALVGGFLQRQTP